MNKNRLAAIIAFALLSLIFVHTTPAQIQVSKQGEVEFNIRFFDRRIYYVTANPVLIQITITNNSPSPYRFKFADDRAFSIDFDVRTMTNRQLPQSDRLIRNRTVNRQVFFREISIESGESFSFVEDLREFTSFSQIGSFRVRARFYPELFRTAATGTTTTAAIESNILAKPEYCAQTSARLSRRRAWYWRR